MTWHLAPPLVTLFGQVDAKFPNRSKTSDGTLGDPAHRARKSDHNPDADGSVNAGDFTHDPDDGLDCRQFSRELAASGDNRIRYVIFNRRIWQPVIGWSGYGGDNPHDKHCHVSIEKPHANDTTEWFEGWLYDLPPLVTPVLEDPDMILICDAPASSDRAAARRSF